MKRVSFFLLASVLIPGCSSDDDNDNNQVDDLTQEELAAEWEVKDFEGSGDTEGEVNGQPVQGYIDAKGVQYNDARVIFLQNPNTVEFEGQITVAFTLNGVAFPEQDIALFQFNGTWSLQGGNTIVIDNETEGQITCQVTSYDGSRLVLWTQDLNYLDYEVDGEATITLERI